MPSISVVETECVDAVVAVVEASLVLVCITMYDNEFLSPRNVNIYIYSNIVSL